MALGKSRLGIFLSGMAEKGRFSRAQRFAADEQGAMYILAMFLFITLLIVSGLSVDLMRYELQRTRLQATMDRALLSAAHPDQQTDRKKVVLDFFDRSGLEDFIKAEDVYVEVEADGTKVTASAHMNVSTPFLEAVGVEYLTAPAAGGAAKINQLTEISLVVDVSGSMNNNATTGNRKIEELHDAAWQFSNLLLCNPNEPKSSVNCTIDKRKTSISLIPYSTQVNVGSDILPLFARIDEQSRAYCATFLDSDFQKAGIDPTVPIRQAAKFVRYGGSYRSSGASSCYTDDWRKVIAFEDSPTQMRDRIFALGASGDTAIDIGTKWGVALLRHEAQPVVTKLIDNGLVHADFAGRPYNPVQTASSKFLVIMTDGENTRHHHLFDGYRTGASPFWVNEQERYDYYGRKYTRTVVSVYQESTNRYKWFYYRGSRYSPYTAWSDHPFGSTGSGDCFGGRYGTSVCSYYGSEEDTNRLSWDELWAKDFTWGFVERFPWLLPDGENAPGRLLSNYEDSDGDGTNDIDKRLLDQCTAAKDVGITVYTIEFETPDSATDVMEKCASYSAKEDRKLYYKVEDDSTLDLPGVFSKIAEDINRLRLIN